MKSSGIVATLIAGEDAVVFAINVTLPLYPVNLFGETHLDERWNNHRQMINGTHAICDSYPNIVRREIGVNLERFWFRGPVWSRSW